MAERHTSKRRPGQNIGKQSYYHQPKVIGPSYGQNTAGRYSNKNDAGIDGIRPTFKATHK